MRRILFLLLILLPALGVEAQYWRVYEADVAPLETVDGANLLTFEDWSDRCHGAGFREDIITDVQVDGNNILYYAEPSVPSLMDGCTKETARGMYRDTWNDWTDSSFTVVMRLAAIKGLERSFDIQWRNGNAGTRDELYLNTMDSTLEFGRSDGMVKVDMDLSKWHIVRVQVIGDSTTVFLDEDPTPVLTSTTTSAESSRYIKMGDPGEFTHGAFIDYILVDTTGAFTPAQSPIPDSLETSTSGEMPVGFGKNVVYVTLQTNKDANGFFADSMNVQNLKDAGFNVMLPSYDSVKVYNSYFKNMVSQSDLVVIGRDVSSGDFQGVNSIYWEKLQKPIILMSPYLARDSRLRWVPSGDANAYFARFGVVQAEVQMPSDPAFQDVSLDPGDITDYVHDNIGMINIIETDRPRISGEVLATLINGPTGYKINTGTGDTIEAVDMSQYDGMPLMIRWEPVVDSMYTGLSNGAAAARPFGWRTFITGGDDHDAYYTATDTLRKFGMDVFSDNMKKVIVNEAVYLISLAVPDISDDNTLKTLGTDVGTLSPDFDPEVSNYTCNVPSGTTEVTITAEVNDTTATILQGTGLIPSADTTVVIKVESEAGSIRDYVIVIKEEIIAEGDTIPPGVGTIEEYLLDAEEGDVYYLRSGGEYTPLAPIEIDKDITLRATEDPELPALTGLPHINNTFALENLIQMRDGAKLKLIGIDLDGEGFATRTISLRDQNATMELYINRCRLHDVIGDIIGVSKSDSVVLKKFTTMNSFVYNADAHGLYVKDFFAEPGVNNDDYLFQDITFWNLGQQVVWIQIFPDNCEQTYTMDHMTGYKLGTNLADVKELIGNSDAGGRYNVTLTNSIFSTQVNALDASLQFTTDNLNGDDNTLELRNLVLYNVAPVVPRPGSGPTPIDNEMNDDPQFADPDNGDFTIGNSAYLTAGDDGTVVGARYWHPDFVDDFGDLETSIPVKFGSFGELNVYPNPVRSHVTFNMSMREASRVQITVYDISGRSVISEAFELGSGGNQVDLYLGNIEAGTYIYTIDTKSDRTAGKLVKIE